VVHESDAQRSGNPSGIASGGASLENANRSGRWTAFLAAVLPCIAMEVWLHFDLRALESGEVESIYVWEPIAWLYEVAGYWGAMSVMPWFVVLWFFVTVSVGRPGVFRASVVLLLSAACLALWGVAAWVVYLPFREGDGFQPIACAIGALPALLGCGFGFLAWRNARMPVEQIVTPKPSRVDTCVEENKWAKAAVVAAIVAIISAVVGMMIYVSMH